MGDEVGEESGDDGGDENGDEGGDERGVFGAEKELKTRVLLLSHNWLSSSTFCRLSGTSKLKDNSRRSSSFEYVFESFFAAFFAIVETSAVL